RKIEFLINNVKPEKKYGEVDVLAPGFAAVREISALLEEVGVQATLTASAFGSWYKDGLERLDLSTEDGYKARTHAGASLEEAAWLVMRDSQSKGGADAKGKNYVVITNGNHFGNSMEEMAHTVGFLRFNPKATLDFVVCSASDKTKVDYLLEALKGTPA